MLVTIVAVPNADNTGLDVDRLEKVEDLPAEVALKMLEIGTAREPSNEELDAYRGNHSASKYDNGGDLQPGQTAAKNSSPSPVVVTPASTIRPNPASDVSTGEAAG
jgi:hypothetical protein